MNPADSIEDLIKNFYAAQKSSVATSAEMDGKVLNDALQALEKTNKSNTADLEPNIWRTIMKSRITKLAVAAVIIVAALVAVYRMGGSVESPAFADIVRPILTARTATYRVSMKGQDVPPDFQVIWMEPSYVRTEMPHGLILIADLEKGKALGLLPAKKKAMVTSISGTFTPFSELRQLIRDAQEGKDQSPEYLGKQRIDGRDAIGYRIPQGRLPSINMPVTIWADAETLLPIRIECHLMPRAPGEQEGTATVTDFQFDVELDPSLFSLDVPDGYTVVEKFEPIEMGPAP